MNIFHRISNPLMSNSFFIFGARGTGKTTLLKNLLFNQKKSHWINLLRPSEEDLYARDPEMIIKIAEEKKDLEWIIIDEVQKVPSLLNVVHELIETKGIKFALTGSSARKLKRGSANLLAGRAFVYNLFPLTAQELKETWNLQQILHWGSLPKLFSFSSEEEKKEYLNAYALTYLKEEIWAEHLIRDLESFRSFLPIAAQTNGEIVNFSKLAHDVQVDPNTIQSYFEILQDTLLGFYLPPFHRSVRKRQRKNPKFYLFDLGVKRALERTIDQPIFPNTYGYGKAFEHLIIIECVRLNEYFRKNYQFSYLRTKNNVEIDLILERPGMKTAIVEIKSTSLVEEHMVSKMEPFLKDLGNCEGFCLSNDPQPKKIGSIHCLPWQQGLIELGL